jgi:hypothetical protein
MKDFFLNTTFLMLYRLSRHFKEDGETRYAYGGKILVNLSLENTMSSSEMESAARLSLQEVLKSGMNPQFGHLFFDWECSSACHIGSYVLPAPITGEIVQDLHENAEWSIESTVNQFGDKHVLRLKVREYYLRIN